MTGSNQMAEITELEPRLVWELFAGIAATPRPSKREGKIREHLRKTVEAKGLAAREDAAGNIVVEVPATSGCEATPLTVLQAHVDMVCEKNRGTEIDFDKDPIRLILDEDASGARIVRADGTTLGADNGIGVAMALAVAFSPDVTHGPLELLLTTDEEAGMTGAKALKPDSFRGRRLLNLDSEEDDSICIGCAGGADTNLRWSFAPEALSGGEETVSLTIEGLRGGHSGCDIHENRGNAIKLLVRTLVRSRVDGLRIASLVGGSKRNAIPREAVAVVAGGPGTMPALRKAAEEVCADARVASMEKAAAYQVSAVSSSGGADCPVAWLNAADSAVVLSAIASLPNGVLGMSPSVPGLVQTSNNVSTVTCAAASGGKRIEMAIGTLSRSSSAEWISATLEQIAAAGRLAGAEVSNANEYPGWEPNPDSTTLATCKCVYERMFGASPEVSAIHAGLECGIIGMRVGDMDMVSFGPTIEGAHSPDERVYVDSVAKSWKYLVAVLSEFAQG